MDSAVLPLDKMVTIQNACKFGASACSRLDDMRGAVLGPRLTLASPTDAGGPEKLRPYAYTARNALRIFHDNLDTGTSCAQSGPSIGNDL